MRLDAERQNRRRHAFVVLLTVNSGATDTLGFLALGGAFTSVMTGNIVLLGVSSARPDGQLARHIGAAILSYIAGCVLGARLAGTSRSDDDVWPRAVNRALIIETAFVTVYAIGWWATGTRPVGAVQIVLLAINAVALGIQSSTVQRFGVGGLSTTYMTGTLTTVVARLASGHGLRAVASSVQLLLSLFAGAAVAGLLIVQARSLVPVLQLLCLTTVILGSLTLTRTDPVASDPVAASDRHR